MILIKDKRHKAFLKFISRLADTSTVYSLKELECFLELAGQDFFAFTPIIKDFIKLAKKTSSDVPYRLTKLGTNYSAVTTYATPKEEHFRPQKHLFDLLRSKELFSSNNDLANFAKRILPSISNKRFDKMSRGDIAIRIIEYIENHNKRDLLEKTIRDALVSMSDSPKDNRKKQTFFRKWENIVKGSDF
jgi:hypothetical protein